MTSGIEMADVIKSTGFPVPEDMEGKTFAEVVEGGGSGDITVEALSATENKVYTAPKGKAYSPVTVNVPAKLYAWGSNGTVRYYPFSVSPSTKSEFDASAFLDAYDNRIIKEEGFTVYSYTKISDTEFEVVFESGLSPVTYTRDATQDIEVW